MRKFNRLWIFAVLAVAALSLSIYFDNPYLNALIFGVLFVLWCGLGAWVTDTIKENEFAVMNRFCKFFFRVDLNECEPFEDEEGE